MPELVENSRPDLGLELDRIGEVLDQRTAVDRDLAGHPLGALEEAVEVRLLAIVILDDDGDVLERPLDLGRQAVQGPANVLVEPGHYQEGRRGLRIANTITVSRPKTKPPTWAKNATPPPASGWRTAKPPSHSWNRNQKPRNRIAGTGTRKKPMNVSTLARGSSTKYAPRTAAIAPLAPRFGMLSSTCDANSNPT